MTEPRNPYFQVGLDVMDRRCLVVGGGAEAEEKSARLLEAGARVSIVSPDLTEQLKAWREDGRVDHRARVFEPGDLEGVLLALNTVERNPEMAREIYGLSSERGILINTFDNPALSNVGMAALVHPGHLRISISTSNASPSLAARLRAGLDEICDNEFVDYLDCLGRVRTHLKSSVPDRKQRVALLRSLTDDFFIAGSFSYPENWRQKAAALLSSSGASPT